VNVLIVLIWLWLTLLITFIGVPCFYYLYLRKISSRDWGLKIDKNYLPTVTVIVPMHNEEKVIRLKLENLAALEYPRDKLQILLVNDGSTDNTLKEVSDFTKNSTLDFTVINFGSQCGKTVALNNALKYANGEIVIVSDSDAFLARDILLKTMPFFADPSVGALISREELIEPEASWVSETEKVYFDLVYGTIKLGESKLHSTIMFHGGFAAYRKSILEKFNVETDDTGTALDIVQKGKRTIMVPDAVSYCFEFSDWKDKFNIKVRRAIHNLKTWIRCLELLFNGELLLSKKIVIPEIFLYLVNPFIFLVFVVVSAVLAIRFFIIMLTFAFIITLMLLIKKTRMLLCEVLQNNLFLVFAVLSLILKKQIIQWKTVQNPRAVVTKEMLKNLQLI
jgi:cellulose synthase/poly-beta-1,6-N-acetylglucosamine synthase-like glycosyltransferase